MSHCKRLKGTLWFEHEQPGRNRTAADLRQTKAQQAVWRGINTKGRDQVVQVYREGAEQEGKYS